MTERITEIMDAGSMQRALKRIAHQILESTKGTDGLLLVGIKRRGVSIARELADYIKSFEGTEAQVEVLDARPYRDDVDRKPPLPESGFEVNGKKIVMVDDVLYTGRTARAGMDAIIQMGRPAFIKLAVLVDRGHRELPIRADFVGKNVPTSREEKVEVCVTEYDGRQGVYLRKNEAWLS